MSGGIATVWLDRPDRGNALSNEAVATLGLAIDAAFADPAVHTLLLRGRGKHFCTGFDLSGMAEETDTSLVERFVALETLLQKVWHAPLRTAAFATGRAWGAGADLFAACDLRAAAPDATFRFPGSAFGIVLGTRRLTEIVGWDRARPLVTEGAMLEAAGARAAGLVTEVVEEDWEDGMARRLAPPVASRDTLAALREAARADHREADMAALVRSASIPGLKERIERYRKSLAKS